MGTPSSVIRLHARDNVAIARSDINGGSHLVELDGLIARSPIPAAHKVAAVDIRRGEPVLRYGQIIGFATSDIEAGDHVHTHNLAMGTFERDYAFGADGSARPSATTVDVFQGIVRADGRVATRNYIGVVSTVNCSATVAKLAVEHFSRPGALEKYPNVDGVVPITHGVGCCIEHNGEGVQQLRRTLGGFVKHPNFAGVVVVGLGCEANQMGAMFMAEGIETAR
jgi:altronate hydrolase